MRIFVAGATGVLGRRVVQKLIAKGHHVVGLSRSEKNRKLLQDFRAEPRFGDLFNREEMSKVTAGCDAILHLATAIPTKSRLTQKDWLVNDRIRREGTANLVAAALKNRIQLYLQESVTFLYGDRNGAWVDETSDIPPRQPRILQSAYDMERIVKDASIQYHLPTIILRFGSFYSHDSAQTASMFGGIRSGRFPIIGKGDAYWNIVNIDDAATAVVQAVRESNKHAGQSFNICDNEPVFARDYLNSIADTLKVKRPRSVPAFLAKIAVGSDLVKVLLSSVRCRNDRAKELLGWQPEYPTYREGIRTEVARWMELSGKGIAG